MMLTKTDTHNIDTFLTNFFNSHKFSIANDSDYNVLEGDDTYIIETPMVGIPKDAIHVSYDPTNEKLTIRGEVEDGDCEEIKYLIKGFRTHNKHELNIKVPTKMVDVEKIEWEYDNGIVRVHCPKLISKRIDIPIKG